MVDDDAKQENMTIWGCLLVALGMMLPIVFPGSYAVMGIGLLINLVAFAVLFTAVMVGKADREQD